jgi:glycosyltransferase involved in cell wall biosynthesis
MTEMPPSFATRRRGKLTVARVAGDGANRPLTVVWSMLNLNPGFMGGTEEYAAGLMREIVTARSAATDGGPQLVALTTKAGASFAVDSVERRVVRALPGGRSLARRLRVFLVSSLHRPLVRLYFADADVVFYPFTALMPLVTHVPTCVLVHDLQHLELPRNFSMAQRIYRSLAYDRRITRADSIVAVSESTRASIMHRLRISGDRIHVIPPGIDGRFFTPRDPAAPQPSTEFLYYPARGLPHKNHATLFEAFGRLRASRPELRLVLTGGDAALLGTLPVGVVHEGRVSRERVRELYQTASAMVFASAFEGYGLPPLEAMACGAPVATSNAGSLPEVCGDAVEYFNPHSADEMAAAIHTVLSNSDEYRQRGYRHVSSRTIERSARAYEQLWQSLVDTN